MTVADCPEWESELSSCEPAGTFASAATRRRDTFHRKWPTICLSRQQTLTQPVSCQKTCNVQPHRRCVKASARRRQHYIATARPTAAAGRKGAALPGLVEAAPYMHGVMLMSIQLHDCPLWPSVAPPAIDQGCVSRARSGERRRDEFINFPGAGVCGVSPTARLTAPSPLPPRRRGGFDNCSFGDARSGLAGVGEVNS